MQRKGRRKGEGEGPRHDEGHSRGARENAHERQDRDAPTVEDLRWRVRERVYIPHRLPARPQRRPSRLES